jgi:hypothetical protein
MEERYLPEHQRLLGSKTTSMNPDGSIIKELKIPYCDYCKKLLGDKIALCSTCQKKLCPLCSITYNSKTYCRECVQEIISVSKQQFLVLFGVASELRPKSIRKISFMNQDKLRECISALLSRKLIEICGVAFFAHYTATDEGLALIQTCEQVYQQEKDVQNFMAKVQEFLGERNSCKAFSRG